MEKVWQFLKKLNLEFTHMTSIPIPRYITQKKWNRYSQNTDVRMFIVVLPTRAHFAYCQRQATKTWDEMLRKGRDFNQGASRPRRWQARNLKTTILSCSGSQVLYRSEMGERKQSKKPLILQTPPRQASGKGMCVWSSCHCSSIEGSEQRHMLV